MEQKYSRLSELIQAFETAALRLFSLITLLLDMWEVLKSHRREVRKSKNSPDSDRVVGIWRYLIFEKFDGQREPATRAAVTPVHTHHVDSAFARGTRLTGQPASH